MEIWSNTAEQSDCLHLRITRMAARNGGTEIVLTVLLSDGVHEEKREFILTVAQYADLKPAKGEIEQEFFDRLEAAATLTAAVKSGAGILAFGANSRRALILKLRRRGYSADCAEQAAELLERDGYLRETSDLVREAERDLAKMWGRKRIVEHLRSRGYDTSCAELEELFADTDFVDRCQQLISRKFGRVPQESKARQRVIASLFRYGYTMEEIRLAAGFGSEF